MQTKHTEGPWKLIGTQLTGKNHVFICHLEGMDIRHREECQANANVIRVAPGLLESLKKTVNSLDYWFKRYGDPEGCNSAMMQEARAVIAEAEGRS